MRAPVVLDVGDVRPAGAISGVWVVESAGAVQVQDPAARVHDAHALGVLLARSLPELDILRALAALVLGLRPIHERQAGPVRHERDRLLVVAQAGIRLHGLDVLGVHAEAFGDAVDVA
ncbi:MAG: hypothetical protein ACK55I_14170, partial [bacterium]